MSHLPTWHQCDYKRYKDIPMTPLEVLIYHYTPADHDEEPFFRAHILGALNEAYSEGTGLSTELAAGYTEPADRIYGDLTPAQISDYQDYEDRKNRGN